MRSGSVLFYPTLQFTALVALAVAFFVENWWPIVVFACGGITWVYWLAKRASLTIWNAQTSRRGRQGFWAALLAVILVAAGMFLAGVVTILAVWGLAGS